MTDLSVRVAQRADLATLQPLIQRAYRGDDARAGWTHEADLLDGERIGVDELEAMIADPAERLLVGFDDDRMVTPRAELRPTLARLIDYVGGQRKAA